MNLFTTTKHKIGESFEAPEAPHGALSTFSLHSTLLDHDGELVLLWSTTMPSPVSDTEQPPAA